MRTISGSQNLQKVDKHSKCVESKAQSCHPQFGLPVSHGFGPYIYSYFGDRGVLDRADYLQTLFPPSLRIPRSKICCYLIFA